MADPYGVRSHVRSLTAMTATGHVPAFVRQLPNRGIQVPAEIFLHQTL